VSRSESETRIRLDEAVVARGLVETRSKAQAIILAGDVTVNGIANSRASSPVRAADVIALRAKPRFVSRGGEKLAHALEIFGLPIDSRICADLGASTGGFTDCLLQAGAARVYAVDVGYGQLDTKLRDDPRVIVLERTNARYLESLPEPVSLVTIDVSFISLRLILPVAARLLEPEGWCLPLIKPQFEAGRGEVGDRGVVKNPETHRKVLRKVLSSAIDNGFSVAGLTISPLRGPEGNIEFLTLLRKSDANVVERSRPDIESLIETVKGGA
jgi:23S rRNA (cytidine1920-2'-O)/16S rRNA (cytidine1409-2'-O)-methyltransferase